MKKPCNVFKLYRNQLFINLAMVATGVFLVIKNKNLEDQLSVLNRKLDKLTENVDEAIN